MRNRYLVCYDVRDPQRLAKTYKKMNGYGDPVQYSVFICELGAKELVFMKEDLSEVLNLEEDRAMIVDMGPAGRQADRKVTTMGTARFDTKKESSIVI